MEFSANNQDYKGHEGSNQNGKSEKLLFEDG